MPDFALDLGFDRIRLLSRRSVDWEFVGEVDTTAPDLTPRLKALISQANDTPGDRLPAWVFLPEDQVLFERIPLSVDDANDVPRAVAQHLDGRTPYSLSQLRADWDPHLDVADVAAVAEETLDEAARFASAHGIDPVAITVRIDPAVFPRHPDFRELPTGAVFRSTRDAAIPAMPTLVQAPARESEQEPEPKAVVPPQKAKARSELPPRAVVVAGGALAATVVGAALLWGLFGGSEPVPDIELTEAEPIARPALVDDLSGVAMPRADAGLAPLPGSQARSPGTPEGENQVLVSPSVDLPDAGAVAPANATFSDQRQPLTPPAPPVSEEVARPPEIALEEASPADAPELDTASASQSFPLSADSVQAEVAAVEEFDPGATELNLTSVPREFILPPGQWPQAPGLDPQAGGTGAFEAGSAPLAVAPAIDVPVTTSPGDVTLPPVEPTRAANDAIQGPDELAPALAPVALPPETELALGEDEDGPVSFAPLDASLRPQARPEAPEIVEPEIVEEEEEQPVVLAVTTSLRPQDRPAPRVRQQQAVAAASTAAVAPQRQSNQSSASAGVDDLVVVPRQQQGGAPTAGRVARAATQSNAIALNKVNLIGVFGSDGARRALVRLPNGRMKRVKVGDRIDGGRVAAIGRSQLSYVKGGRTIQLAVPSG